MSITVKELIRRLQEYDHPEAVVHIETDGARSRRTIKSTSQCWGPNSFTITPHHVEPVESPDAEGRG